MDGEVLIQELATNERCRLMRGAGVVSEHRLEDSSVRELIDYSDV